MDELVHDVGYDHARLPAHGRVHGMLAQKAAVQPVVGVGGDGTDHVARIDVFEIVRYLFG